MSEVEEYVVRWEYQRREDQVNEWLPRVMRFVGDQEQVAINYAKALWHGNSADVPEHYDVKHVRVFKVTEVPVATFSLDCGETGCAP